MNENLIDNLNPDSNYNIQYCVQNKHESNQVFQDNDSDSSILNLLDTELSDKTPEEAFSPYYSMAESGNHNDVICHSKQLAIPDIKSDTTDQRFEELLLSNLPQIIAVEKSSIQYEVQDQNYPCLSKSFKNCFNSPVLDLLVVVLNTEQLVSFYQGYFAGIPRLANELINLNRMYWKSLISNNDGIAWENHSKCVIDKFNSLETNEPEFEVGPVIRCRLKAPTKQQFNQQFNYFFVQPCSYMVHLSQLNRSCHGFNLNDTDSNVDSIFMVSYINIMRECDTEYALKGSAAASLQRVLMNSSNMLRMKSQTSTDNPINKPVNNPSKKIVNNTQLSINISSPAYTSHENPLINAPLTYPLSHEQQYLKQRTQIPQYPNSQHRQSMPIMNNQYMPRGVSINIIDPSQHHYQGHYQVPQSTSTLQYILENRHPHYPTSKQIHNAPHQMVSQQVQPYQPSGRPNLPCYRPTDHSQQTTGTNCSLSSPTNFLQTRHLVPMSSTGILLSSEQYFRNTHQINVIDSVQIAQPMMTVVRSMPSTPNNYFGGSTSQAQLPQNPVHVINSMSHQNQFSLLSSSTSSSTLASYSNNKNDLVHLNSQTYHVNGMTNTISIKQETEDISITKKDWRTKPIIGDSNSTTYCGSLNSLPMTNDSISFEIVEEILKAEEAKSENKQNVLALSISDNSEQLSFDLDDFVLLEQSNNSRVPISSNPTTKVNSNSHFEVHHDEKNYDRDFYQQSSNSSDSLLSLKSDTLERFTNAQKIGIKNFVNQHKHGKLTKEQMLHQINDFISQTLGKNNHYRRIVEYWNTQHPSVDSTLSHLNCSHVIQSPEEGPGISPTEQAAQSTTDIEDDKDFNRNQTKPTPKKPREDSMSELIRQRSRSKSTKSNDASIYRITSTTSTGVLETLLNEHDNPVTSEKSYTNSNSKFSISSTPKHQLSLDQLLMDDECSMLAGFTPNSDFKKSSDNPARQMSSNIKSQPSTPSVTGNMGVLESLLNQKTPSLHGIRQKSTESILQHSRPSRQNSLETFHEEEINTGDNNGMKKNSLLITLLNNSSTRNTSADKYNAVNTSTPCSIDLNYSGSQPKRQRMFSGANVTPSNNCSSNKKQIEKVSNVGMEVFDFVDYELNYTTTEFQSGTVTSSQSLSTPKTPQNKRNRKRCYSKEMSVDSDGSSDKQSNSDRNSSSVSNSISSDKKVILTSLLETQKMDDTRMSTTNPDMCSRIENSNQHDFVETSDKNPVNYDDNIDFEDIKIDDFDLEHLIDIPEQMDESTINENRPVGPSIQVNHESSIFNRSYSASPFDMNNAPVYTMVTPVISISQSDPIVPVSKQSIIRLSDKNSILFSAIQSTTSMSTISVECLDNERERLLKQQQQQKVYMGGKYLPLNQIGTVDVDSQTNKINHTLSLDLLSKQLKEVGPNVMVEPSNPVDSVRPRKSSFSRNIHAMSPAMVASSPIGRTLSSSEIPNENNKLVTTSSSNVNHQQVREGLRQLVSNRSAQNNSRNIGNNQRQNGAGFNELMSPSSEFNVHRNTSTSSSSSKSMIHYHSDTHIVSNNVKTEQSPVPSYPISIVHSSIAPLSDSKATNILEDSLVNDVFELEELVNSKTSKSVVDNTNYQSMNVSKPSSEPASSNSTGDGQLMTISSPEMNSSPMVNAQTNLRQVHHHHHLQHYHHHHQHHHHHTAPTSMATTDTITPTSKNRQTTNSNSGLLETLLSK